MPATISAANQKFETSLSDNLIADKTLDFYWKASRFFIVLLIILEIFNVILNRIPFGTWIMVAIVAMLFTWWLLRRFRVRLTAALTANAVLGLLAGFFMAIFEIIWHRQWWYILNLLRRPVLLGVAAMAVSFVFYLVFQSIITKHRVKQI